MGKAQTELSQSEQVSRKRLIALIHIAKQDLGLSDADYRALLHGATGIYSCKDMNINQLNATLRAFENLGWKRKIKRSAGKKVRKFDPTQNDPRLKKIWKLWYRLCDAGLANRSAKSLNKFIKRQTGIEKMEWLEQDKDFIAVIEALKSWYERETASAK
jgi:hypothetical protein